MTRITVVVDGRAVAKGRPRSTRSGITYTPAKTRKWEAAARFAAQVAMGDRPPFDGPVTMRILVYLPLLASFSKAKAAEARAGRLLPKTRPDLDNYIKASMDAINEIVVVDDSQICTIHAGKRYGDKPRMKITIEPAKETT